MKIKMKQLGYSNLKILMDDNNPWSQTIAQRTRHIASDDITVTAREAHGLANIPS